MIEVSGKWQEIQKYAGRDFPYYQYCGKCGRKLTDKRSQKRGFGPCCYAYKNMYRPGVPIVILNIIAD